LQRCKLGTIDSHKNWRFARNSLIGLMAVFMASGCVKVNTPHSAEKPELASGNPKNSDSPLMKVQSKSSTLQKLNKGNEHSTDSELSSDCKLQTQFRLATRIPTMIAAYDDRYAVIAGVEGRYELQKSPSTRNFSNIDKYETYIYSIEDTILKFANGLKCKAEDKSYEIDVTIIPLTIADPFTGDVSKPYGYLNLDKGNQKIQGLFYLNPIQILADQFWLHEGKEVPSEQLSFTPEEFSIWVADYTKFRYKKTEKLAEKINDIPVHVMWLFLVSPKTTSNIFAFDQWHKIVLSSLEGYTMITQEIIKTEFCEDCLIKGTPLKALGSSELFNAYSYNP